MAKPKVLRTPEAVIEALGGLVPVAKMTGREDSGVVWNWYERGLPINTYPVITEALDRIGKKASPEVWGNRSVASNVLAPARRTDRKLEKCA